MIDLTLNLSRVRFLPAYFDVIGQLLALLDTGTSDMAQIVSLVESDQALASHTLAAVNAGFYNLPRQIDRLDEAVSYLGLDELRSMAMSVAMHDITGGIRTEEWKHSLAVANLAGRLYQPAANQNQEETRRMVFAAALMHDIGKLYLSRSYMVVYARVHARIRAGAPALETEREVFGYDHAEVGGMMLAQWKIPALIAEAVAHHHAPGGKSTARAIQLADRTAHLLELPRATAADQVEALTGRGWIELTSIVEQGIEKSTIFQGR